jgi:hypothetical protein
LVHVAFGNEEQEAEHAGTVNNEQNVGGLPVDEVPVQAENLLGVGAVNNEHIKGDLPVEA